MKGYVIELHATFAYKANSKEEALEAIFNNIDLNETEWCDEVIEEISEDEFDNRFAF